MSEPVLNARQQAVFWLGAFAVFCGLVWLLEDMLLPFVLGLGIAYLLNPMVEWFERREYPRSVVSLGLLVFFLGFLTVFLAIFLPMIYRQVLQLAQDIPDMTASLWEFIEPYTRWIGAEMEIEDTQDLSALVQENMGSIWEVARRLMGGVAAGSQAVIGILSIVFLTPIAAYFMLKEWPAIKGWVDDIMPRQHESTIKDLLSKINDKIAGFIRGQLAVVSAIALMYSVALTIAGLNYGILIGILAGVLSLIPLFGSFSGLLISIVVAWFQSGEWSYVLIIAAIFLVGQAIEGNLITPRLVGKYVGLHPLWVLFVLLAGGSLFGIVGMLLAVPVAASAGVLINFAIQTYKNSSLYKDK
jgi:predicted PurR-regulated permease PerM